MRFSKFVVASAIFGLGVVAEFQPEERAALNLGGLSKLLPGKGSPKPAPAALPPPKPAVPKPAPPPPAPAKPAPTPADKKPAPPSPAKSQAAPPPAKSQAAPAPSANSKQAPPAVKTSASVQQTKASSTQQAVSKTSASTASSSTDAAACPVPGKATAGKRAAPAAGASTCQQVDKNTAPGGKNQNGCGADGQIDCSGEGAQTCATMCYAALCFGSNRATGLQLEGETTNTGPLTKGDGKNIQKGTTGPRVDNRSLSGCNANPAGGFVTAGLTVSGASCDEWPPASATNGGEGAVLQMVKSQKAQSAAVKAGVNVGKNGLILMRKFQGVQECVDLQNKNTASCGTSKKFAIFDKAPRNQRGSTFRQATF
jgi:Deoxyribonuclease NucA/NucB